MEKRHYEILFILRPAKDEEITTQVDKFAAILKKEGEIERLEQWGLQQLAYAIRDHRRGFYVLINAFCPAAVMDALQELFRFDNNILRFMIMRCRKEQKDESSMLRNIREAQSRTRRPNVADPASTRKVDAAAPIPEKATESDVAVVVEDLDRSGEDIDPDADQSDASAPDQAAPKSADGEPSSPKPEQEDKEPDQASDPAKSAENTDRSASQSTESEEDKQKE